jgi:hypothetical protein
MEFKEWLVLQEGPLPPGYDRMKRTQAGIGAIGNALSAGTDILGGPVNAVAGLGHAAKNTVAALGGESGRRFARGVDNMVDRVKKKFPRLGEKMWVRDGTGDPKYDIDDTLTAMISDAQKREIEAALEKTLKRSGYRTDQEVPDHLGNMVAVSVLGRKVDQVKGNLGLDQDRINTAMRFRSAFTT